MLAALPLAVTPVVVTLLLLLLLTGAARAGPTAVTLQAVNWSATPLKVASTASTVEVDVMPFLSRSPEGGPFDAYYEALSGLGAEFVRYAPWYPYPRVVVTELTPPDCTATRPATNWNSTHFDAIMRDFMAAVCGPDAASGKCKHSVIQQLSTMPSWLYVNGSDPDLVPPDPWQYHVTDCVTAKMPYADRCPGFGAYNNGTALKDESCKPMAAYFARLVEHYTQGGHHDSCGHWHPSGFNYSWYGVSVLNEDEHKTGQERYTRCFDQIKLAVRKINKDIVFAGPEGTGYTAYLIDPKNHLNHDPSLVPEILSFHGGADGGPPSADGMGNGGASYGDHFFKGVDRDVKRQAALVPLRDRLAPKSEFVTNEFIVFMHDWCDLESAAELFEQYPELQRDPDSPGVLRADGTVAGGCPQWSDEKANSVKINRKTRGWNAAAAAFAYGWGSLALKGWKLVGADQLIGGPWPDNEPAVSCMDWHTGEVNAKYYAIQMLATLGRGEKSFLPVDLASPAPGPPVPPAPPIPAGTIATGCCGPTVTGGNCNSDPNGAWGAKAHGITSLAECVAKVKQCSMGHFVSFSAQNDDCSWYADCNGWPPAMPMKIYQSEVINATGTHNVPSPPPAAGDTQLFALPYIVHEQDNSRGMLLIAKTNDGVEVTLTGVPNGTTALVLEGTDPDEPGFSPPTEKAVGADGKLSIGPYAVALVSFPS